MYDKPTVNDFLRIVQDCTDAGNKRLLQEINRAKAEATKVGALNSGRFVLVLTGVAQLVFEETVAEVLGELRRFIEKTDLSRDELRNLTYGRLADYQRATQSIVRGDATIKRLGERLLPAEFVELPQRLLFLQRKFDIGMDQKAEPFMVVNNNQNNSVNVGSATNSQIAGPNSNQTAIVSINVQSIGDSVRNFEVALEGIALDDKTRQEIQDDLATVRSQLRREKPSVSLLKSVGESLKSILEGIAAGVLTEPAITAGAALLTALGVS